MKHITLIVAWLLILLSSSLCQESDSTDPRLAFLLLQHILSKAQVSGSIAYWGHCEAHKRYPGFPSLREPFNYSRPTVDLLRQVFVNDPKMVVTQESDGLIRMVENDVPMDLLRIKIHHLSFGHPDQDTDMFNGPNNALRAVLFAPEVVAYRKAHRIGPFADRWTGPGDSASKQPQISGDLYDVTVQQALDYILRTFPGFWIYENCQAKEAEVERNVFISFYTTDLPRPD